jgi:hypothetical protein
MDPLSARRTQAGALVVHGIHNLLWALDALAVCGQLSSSVKALRVRFSKLVYVGDVVEVGVEKVDDRELSARVAVDGTPVLTVVLEFGDRRAHAEQPLQWNFPASTWPATPEPLGFDDLPGRQGALAFAAPPNAIAAAFPALTAAIGEYRVAALACTSRLVGMACPGLYSILSSVNVALVEGPPLATGLNFAVIRVDERFRSLVQTIAGGGIEGTVEAFFRQPPTEQPPIAELARHVAPDAFAGQAALVAGGSRGLGALTAKLLAVGGARVIATYAVGQAEATALASEITAWGGKCHILHYDARMPARPQMGALPTHPSFLYYFATGPIFRRKTRLFDPAILEDFIAIYVRGFQDLCQALAGDRARPLRAYYPSSVAVSADQRPRDMTEYAMAKAAGEILCQELKRFMPGVTTIVTRLPRLSTDQTASIFPIATASPVEVMLPVLLEVQGV